MSLRLQQTAERSPVISVRCELGFCNELVVGVSSEWEAPAPSRAARGSVKHFHSIFLFADDEVRLG